MLSSDRKGLSLPRSSSVHGAAAPAQRARLEAFVRPAAFAVGLIASTLAVGDGARGHEATAPVLWDGLGTLHYAVTTAKPEAQAYFDQGLRLAYAFNHAEARRAFHHAQELDPSCALCFWGEALVVGPNINASMNPNDLAPALRRAIAMVKRGEPALVDVLTQPQ